MADLRSPSFNQPLLVNEPGSTDTTELESWETILPKLAAAKQEFISLYVQASIEFKEHKTSTKLAALKTAFTHWDGLIGVAQLYADPDPDPEVTHPLNLAECQAKVAPLQAQKDEALFYEDHLNAPGEIYPNSQPSPTLKKTPTPSRANTPRPEIIFKAAAPTVLATGQTQPPTPTAPKLNVDTETSAAPYHAAPKSPVNQTRGVLQENVALLQTPSWSFSDLLTYCFGYGRNKQQQPTAAVDSVNNGPTPGAR